MCYELLDTIDWKIVLWLGVSSTLLAIAGAFLTNFVEVSYLKLVLGIFLIGFSVLFYFKPKATIPATHTNNSPSSTARRLAYPI